MNKIKISENKLKQFGFKLTSVKSNNVKIKKLGIFDDEYVYDIEVKDGSHTFVAENVLAHNSCAHLTKINGTLQTISEIFEDYKKSGHIEKLRNDVEVAIPNEKNKKTCYSLNGITKIKNVSKHLVNKDKWKINIDGKELFITNDHSIMIYRNGEVIECKPEDIKSTDYILKRKMI